MYLDTDRNLTDNAWADRTQYLRQIVDDGYDPAAGTPNEWVTWLVDYADEEFDDSDIASLRNWATRRVSA